MRQSSQKKENVCELTRLFLGGVGVFALVIDLPLWKGF